MAKNSGQSCPLCLDVYDPADMLVVVIPHARIRQDPPAQFCRRCVVAFMQSAAASDLIDPSEVFGSSPEPTASSPQEQSPTAEGAAGKAAAAPTSPLGETRPGHQSCCSDPNCDGCWPDKVDVDDSEHCE